MSSVTMDSDVGGDGNTYTDDNDASTGLAAYGWTTRLIPLFSALIGVANYMKGLAEDFGGGADLTAASSSSVAVGTGTKTFTIQSGKAFVAGSPVVIADTAAPTTNLMYGSVTSYSGTTLEVSVSTYAGSGTISSWSISVGGAGSLNAVLTDAQSLTSAQKSQVLANLGVAPREINGLDLSNSSADSDTNHDIGIAAGFAFSDDANPVPIRLASAIYKKMDATFAAGTGNGGMASGESLPTSGTVHFWLIMKADGTVDVFGNDHATSGLSPTLPTGFIYKRYLGSLVTDGSAVFRQFFWFGDGRSVTVKFQAGRIPSNSGTTNMASASLLTINGTNNLVPLGVRTEPLWSLDFIVNATSVAYNEMGDGDATAMGLRYGHVGSNASAIRQSPAFSGIYTNTSGQVYFKRTVSSGTVSANDLYVYGYRMKR